MKIFSEIVPAMIKSVEFRVIIAAVSWLILLTIFFKASESEVAYEIAANLLSKFQIEPRTATKIYLYVLYQIYFIVLAIFCIGANPYLMRALFSDQRYEAKRPILRVVISWLCYLACQPIVILTFFSYGKFWIDSSWIEFSLDIYRRIDDVISNIQTIFLLLVFLAFYLRSLIHLITDIGFILASVTTSVKKY